MPTNLKFRIGDVAVIKYPLLKIGFHFIESNNITDIYLQAEQGETKKLRIDFTGARLISFSRLNNGEIVSSPSIEFVSVEDGLRHIESKEKITKTIEKRIEVYLRDKSRVMFHFFETQNKDIYLSLEEVDESIALEILKILGLNIHDRIEASFDELIS